MPYGDPDPTDPSVLVGVSLPGGPETMREMAEVFADEFARMGHSPRQILGLFRNPFYGGPHAALQALGGPAIEEIIAQSAGRWPQVHVTDTQVALSDEEIAYASLADKEDC